MHRLLKVITNPKAKVNMDVPLALKNIGNPIGLRDMEESPQRSALGQTSSDFLRLYSI